MFGRKQRQIDKLNEQIDNLMKGTTQVIQEKMDLARELREMDNIIFQMANQPGWPEMRPFFQRMSEQSMTRKLLESKRINDLLLPELEATYGKPKKALPSS